MRAFLFSGLLLGLTLMACSGSDGGGGPPAPLPTNDLSSKGMAVVTPDEHIQAAHPFELDVTLQCIEHALDISVEFDLLYKPDVDAGLEEIRQFTLKAPVIPYLPEGESQHRMKLWIPAELEPAGDYYLVCHCDPQGLLPEIDEDNNYPDAVAAKRVVVAVDDSMRRVPDLVLEEVEVDAQVVALHPFDVEDYDQRDDVEDQKNHHFGLTALVSASGADPVANVEIAVRLQMSDGLFEDLTIWEGEDQAPVGYLSRHVIPSLDPEEPESLQLCVRIPEWLREQLEVDAELAGFVTRRLSVVVDPDQEIDEFEASVQLADRGYDNELQMDLTFAGRSVQIGPDWLAFDKSYEKGWLKASFGVGIDHWTEAYVAKDEFDSETRSSLMVTVFGREFEFLGFAGDGYAKSPDPDVALEPDQIPFDYSIQFVGTTIYHPSYEELKAKGTIDFWVQKDYPVDAKGRKGYAKRFIVYGIPVTVRAWAWGKIGAKASLIVERAETPQELRSGLTVEAGPYCAIGVSATGTVNLGVVKPGVGTSLELVREELIAHVGGELIVTKVPEPKLEFLLDYGMTNRVHGPNGKFWVFVKYPKLKWFGKVRWRTAKATIVKWKTFVKEDVLVNKQTTLEFSQ